MGESAAGDGTQEREVKAAVAQDYVLPGLAELDGVVVTDRGDERLRAVYWDTNDLALAHAGVGMRHRNGVWTYKGRSRRDGDAVVREEVETSGDADTIPADIRLRVKRWVDADALHPVAELDAMRHHVDVVDGQQSVEVVHDRVTVLDRGRSVSSFGEVEVEFAPASQGLADRVVALLVSAGARVDTTPKLVRALRALGYDPPEVSM
ncbi:MAG: CYTH domain-containing protein [Candidatus Dormibacteraeota bacterium]|nr:CYTH domain-containing protein [Candidatus Dormibacteraeota bacterium]